MRSAGGPVANGSRVEVRQVRDDHLLLGFQLGEGGTDLVEAHHRQLVVRPLRRAEASLLHQAGGGEQRELAADGDLRQARRGEELVEIGEALRETAQDAQPVATGQQLGRREEVRIHCRSIRPGRPSRRRRVGSDRAHRTLSPAGFSARICSSRRACCGRRTARSSIGATCVQVFADNPTAWRRKPQPPAKIAEFRARLEAGGVGRLAVHASYLVNLAAANPEFRERSIENLVSDLRMGAAYGAHAVNVHIGSHVGQGVETGTRLVGEGIAEVLRRVSDEADTPRLVLENSAGGGGTLGTTVPEVAAILRAATAAGAPKARVGICLDTAHLWGSGYDLSDPDAIDALVLEVDREIGLERACDAPLQRLEGEARIPPRPA